MSVLIKGMEMPETCDDCIFSDWSRLHQTACCKLNEYKACFEDFSAEYAIKTGKDCPLVEVPPHGRLIDADELIRFEYGGICFVPVEFIDNAPTIIEAEE